jgi:hypothetical protein
MLIIKCENNNNPHVTVNEFDSFACVEFSTNEYRDFHLSIAYVTVLNKFQQKLILRLLNK